MQDIALHILDIAENSISAGATRVTIAIREDLAGDLLTLEITDDGEGMDPVEAARTVDPFYTTRRDRRVGLGLPLLHAAARAANGRMEVKSGKGEGTRIVASFQLSHIDRKPIGNMPEAMTTLVARGPDVEFSYTHQRNHHTLSFSTADIREHLCGSPMNSASVLCYIRTYLTEEEKRLGTST